MSRAVRDGAGRLCWAIACGGGPPPRARTSCPGCACAWSCGATHGTVARACWCRRATGATLHRPWSPYATGTGPQRRPQALGRHDEPQRPEPPPASACSLVCLRGGINSVLNAHCADAKTTPRRCPWDRGRSQRTARPPQDRPACTSRASSCLGAWVVSGAGARHAVRGRAGMQGSLV